MPFEETSLCIWVRIAGLASLRAWVNQPKLELISELTQVEQYLAAAIFFLVLNLFCSELAQWSLLSCGGVGLP